jgi:hypothetical protein
MREEDRDPLADVIGIAFALFIILIIIIFEKC